MTLVKAVTVAATTIAAVALTCSPANAGLTTPSRIDCDTATLWGNYSPSAGHQDPITVLTRGTRVGWRYTTDDGRSAMVLWYQGEKWGFVQRSCVAVGTG